MRIKSVPPKIEDEYDLTEIYPFFTWKECEVCHDKIKRERMWDLHVLSTSRWGDLEYGSTKYNRHYLCTSCFPTRESINEYFVKQTHTVRSRSATVEEAVEMLSPPCYENKNHK